MTIGTGPSRRYLSSKNLILLLVMAVLIILAILAWFSFTKTVSANNIVVKAVSTEIDIAECVKTYDAEQNVLTDGPGVFGDSVSFNGPYKLTKDCTGDGKNLIVPEFNVAKDPEAVRQTGKEVNVNLTPANALSNLDAEKQHILHPDQEPPEYQYIKCEFYVRSKNKDLNLASESKLIAESEKGPNPVNITTPITDNNNPKKSSYGNFNVDGIVGAIRVALIGEGCTSCNQTWVNNEVVKTGNNAPNTVREVPEKQLLWVPRPDVYLHVAENQGDTDDWTLQYSAKGGSYNNFTYKHSYYKKKDSGVGVEKVETDTDGRTKISDGNVSTPGDKPIFGENFNISDYSDRVTYEPISGIVVDSSDTSVTDSYYISKYTMNIWIEGTDAEARRAMDGGAFDLELYFM